jgi:hypothetical protein
MDVEEKVFAFVAAFSSGEEVSKPGGYIKSFTRACEVDWCLETTYKVLCDINNWRLVSQVEKVKQTLEPWCGGAS